MELQESGPKLYTKKELEDFLFAITERVNSSDDAYMHSVLAFNHILRQPNAIELFDDEMKKTAKDLWCKIRAMGVVLTDPPLLFGAPELTEDSH